MYFGFSEEEKMLQSSVNRFFKRNMPIEQVRSFMEKPYISNQFKKAIGNQGLIGTLESKGDRIEGVLPTIAVLEEAGRSLLPYPLMENVIGAFLLSMDPSKHKFFEQVINGQLLLSIAWGMGEKVYTTKEQSGYRVNGKFTGVAFSKQADKILVKLEDVDQTGDKSRINIGILDVKNPSVKIIERDSMDQTYPMAEVVVNDCNLEEESVILGEGRELKEILINLSALLSSAEMLGISEEVLKRTVDYTMVRKQFGTEIGRFQAIKHMAADMYVLVESARVAVLYAAWALQKGIEPESISMAKAYTSDAATKVTGLGIQMHGGIGFTWESDMHLFFKRARRSASMYGDAYFHRELVMRKLHNNTMNKTVYQKA